MFFIFWIKIIHLFRYGINESKTRIALVSAIIYDCVVEERREIMIIDANMYWFDENIFTDEKLLNQFIEEVKQIDHYNAYAKVNSDNRVQIVIEKPYGKQNLNYLQGEYKLETQLADMDQANVDKAILKMPGCAEWMSLDMCKRFNNGMDEYARASNGRLIPLGVVPPVASKEVFDEIDRCFNELGFKGMQLAAHYDDKYLDDESFSEFFDKLNEYNATVYIHHTPVPVDYNSLLDYDNLRRSYGRCVDQVTAIGREIFSDFFDKHPNLKFVHSMLGGGFFTIYDMMLPHVSSDETVSRFNTNVSLVRKHLKENIYFEMSHSQPWGKRQLECAIEVLGSDRVIWGTSYPVRKEWLLQGVQFVQALDIAKDDKNLVLGENALLVYHIDR